jgi:ABC-type multidrug transport system ATPase subunit
MIAELNKSGSSIILTTHQMEVAEKLSHRICIIDQGKIIALETLEDLKAKVGPEATLEEVFIKLTGSKMRDAPKKSRFLAPFLDEKPHQDSLSFIDCCLERSD